MTAAGGPLPGCSPPTAAAAAAGVAAAAAAAATACVDRRPSSPPQTPRPSRAGSLVVVCLILAATTLLLQTRQDKVLLATNTSPYEHQGIGTRTTAILREDLAGQEEATSNAAISRLDARKDQAQQDSPSLGSSVGKLLAITKSPAAPAPAGATPAVPAKPAPAAPPPPPPAPAEPCPAVLIPPKQPPTQVERAAAAAPPPKSEPKKVTKQTKWPFPVRAFWHIGESETLMWLLVVREQLARIQRSGLLDIASVRAYFVGEFNNQPDLHDERIPVEYVGPSTTYEYGTLRKLEEYCKENRDARVLYFHTKGATHPLTEAKGWHVYHWRMLLEHFLIDNHEAMLHELRDRSGYAAVGPMYYVSPFHQAPHFSGNFWAAKCSYINTVQRINNTDVKDRLLAEFYVGLSPHFRYKDCWQIYNSDGCNPNTYDCNYDERLYKDFRGCGRPPEQTR